MKTVLLTQIVAAFILTACPTGPVSASDYDHPIYGIHFYGHGAEHTIKNGVPMWTLEMHYTSHAKDWTSERFKLAHVKSRGFKVIMRLDYGVGFTVPYAKGGKYFWHGREDFAKGCGRVAKELGDLIDVFVIGNEIDPQAEGPEAEWYALCFNAGDEYCAYDQIKKYAPHAKVCMYAPTGWPNDDHIKYWETVLANIDRDEDGLPQVDAFALHAYSGASTTEDSSLEDPRFSSTNDFAGFHPYARRIYEIYGGKKEIYITESNTQWYFGTWATDPKYSQDSYEPGWMQQAYMAIDNWNKANDQKVHALCWYVYQHQCIEYCDQYENSLVRTDNWRLNSAREDYSDLTSSTFYCPNAPGSPILIQAENYINSDTRGGPGITNGIENVDYFDSTPGNAGKTYRNQDVDIARLRGENYFVGWTTAGEWLIFESLFGGQPYKLELRCRNVTDSCSQVALEIDGKTTCTISVPPASENTFAQVTSDTPIMVEKGLHKLKIHFVDGGVDLDWFMLSPSH